MAVVAKLATPKDLNSEKHAESPALLVQDLSSTSSSTATNKPDLSQMCCDEPLSDDVVPTTEPSVRTSTVSDPTRTQSLVMAKPNEDIPLSYQSRMARTHCEYRHPIPEYRQLQKAPLFTTSHEYSVIPSVSHPQHQESLCRWLYENSDENMTMAEILEKSNWKAQRLEKL